MTLTPEMVERVARALCSAWGLDWEMLEQSHAPGRDACRDNFLQDAAVAIEAYEAALEAAGLVIVPREATKLMLEKGFMAPAWLPDEAEGGKPDPRRPYAEAEVTWQAMLNAALEPKDATTAAKEA